MYVDIHLQFIIKLYLSYIHVLMHGHVKCFECQQSTKCYDAHTNNNIYIHLMIFICMCMTMCIVQLVTKLIVVLTSSQLATYKRAAISYMCHFRCSLSSTMLISTIALLPLLGTICVLPDVVEANKQVSNNISISCTV